MPVRRMGNEGLHLGQNAVDDKTRRQARPRLAHSQALEHLVNLDAEFSQTPHVVANVGRMVERVHGQHEIRQVGLDAEHLVNREIVVAPGLATGVVVQEPVHDLDRAVQRRA